MRAMRIGFGCLFGLLALVASRADERPATGPAPFRIAGYLPDYRKFDPAAADGLTDMILFSAEPTAEGRLDLARLKKMPWAELRAFQQRQRVRLILCVGGWQRSTHFAAVAGAASLRSEFVKEAVRVCLDERLSGVDLDWEHPQNESEQNGYAQLLAELHEAFEPHGLALSVTVAAWQKIPSNAFGAVDWVNVMSYDHPGRHSTWEDARADVDLLVHAGAPAGKITLGLPFYGRDPKKPDRVLAYRDIIAKHHPGPAVDEVDNLYFNGLGTISRKTEFAVEAGLAGVMVWELCQDAPGDHSLLTAIRGVAERSRK